MSTDRPPEPPITDVQMIQLRTVVAKVLELPRSDVGCIVIVAYATPGGQSAQKTICMGLDVEGIRMVLAGSLESALTDTPRSGTFTAVVED